MLIATGSKAAAFAALLRVLLLAFRDAQAHWAPLMWGLAALSMTLGNVVALAQRDLKRMLAYSSIAHGGYMLVGVVAGGTLGHGSVLFYLLVYTFTTAGSFGAVLLLERRGEETVDVGQVEGLSASHPLLAFNDSDDEWIPGKLALQRAFMQARPEVVFCFSDLGLRDADGSESHDGLRGWHDRAVPAAGTAEEIDADRARTGPVPVPPAGRRLTSGAPGRAACRPRDGRHDSGRSPWRCATTAKGVTQWPVTGNTQRSSPRWLLKRWCAIASERPTAPAAARPIRTPSNPTRTRRTLFTTGKQATNLNAFFLIVPSATQRALDANIWTSEFLDATLVIDGIVHDHVGIPYRGRGWRVHPKKSYTSIW